MVELLRWNEDCLFIRHVSPNSFASGACCGVTDVALEILSRATWVG